MKQRELKEEEKFHKLKQTDKDKTSLSEQKANSEEDDKTAELLTPILLLTDFYWVPAIHSHYN